MYSPDPLEELKDREAQIRRQQAAAMDPKEQAEREEAAGAYAIENEKHFVDYLHDCVDTSIKETGETRQAWSDCWNTFKEREPKSYQYKEEWQARTMVPKPYSAVIFGAAAVKKAFSPDFISIVDSSDPVSSMFWRHLLKLQTDKTHGQLVTRVVDASVMALAVGQSMEMIPRYTSQHGLTIDLVEPWKICRDPDAPARDPQGGLYWIHQEWLDYHILLAGERAGKYVDVARVKEMGDPAPDNPFMTQEAIKRRKDQTFQRSKFRQLLLTSEFFGGVIGPNGDMLLPSGTFTVTGGRVIGVPHVPAYRRLRWPGISFSPLPDVLTYGGAGVLRESVVRLWESMSNLLCLHEDNLKFIVHPPTEINVDGLVDPEDIDDWPGKKFLTRNTAHGQQIIRPVSRSDPTNSILANLQYYDQGFQRGSFVTDSVQGLPGYRKDITAFEVSQSLDQAMAVFGLMGGNVEQGVVELLLAIVDVLTSFAPAHELIAMIDDANLQADLLNTGGGRLPALSGNFSVSGMSELLKQGETLNALTNIIIPLSADPEYGKYINRYKVLSGIEARTNLKDEDVIVSADQASEIDEVDRQIKKQMMNAEAAAAAGEGGQVPGGDPGMAMPAEGGVA